MVTPPTRLLVSAQLADQRVDLALAQATALSRRRARSLLSEGRIVRNGKILRVASRMLEVGDVIDIALAAEELGVPPRPVVPAVSILARSGGLLAIDKPAGTLSQPAERRQPGELAADEQLLLTLALEAGRRPFLRLVHRLDRVTSGVLLFATRPQVLPAVTRAWQNGKVERSYVAIIDGQPEWDRRRIDAAMARSRDGAWRFEVSDGGRQAKPAITQVVVEARGDGWSRVRCRLETGRTHQVRVHLAHLGHPVRGDRLYGSTVDAPRPLLHAAQLSLPHPGTGRPWTARAPLPNDFVGFGSS